MATYPYLICPAPPRYQAARAVLIIIEGLSMSSPDRARSLSGLMEKWNREYNREFMKVYDGSQGGWKVE